MENQPITVRKPGKVLMLALVTLGVYWYFWLAKAFGEVWSSLGRPRNTWRELAGPILLGLAGTTLNVAGTLQSIAAIRRATTVPPSSLSPSLNVLQMVGLALLVLSIGWQLLYVRKGLAALREAELRVGPATAPSLLLSVLAFVLFIPGMMVPLGGIAFMLAGGVLQLVWYVRVQRSMNRLAAGPPTA